MAEKEVETQLDLLLKGFNKAYIYYTPTQSDSLKQIFAKASKNGNARGIPDRIYYDETTMIIFECKIKNMSDAVRDLKKYSKKIAETSAKTFYVAMVKDKYEIYDSEFSRKDFLLEPQNFGIKQEINYGIMTLEQDIHRINNYIRNHTKISDGDKSFFIAIILISLKKPSFCKIMDNYETKEYIYDIMRQNIVDFGIDISVFEFLRNDKNNEHFYQIIKMVRQILAAAKDNIDLINEFYSEFVKYGNTDGKSLGIVLTPHHIVELMIHMLNISADDIFLDLCSGTGSFVLEAHKRGCATVACEFQTKLYSLLKCNMILHDINPIDMKCGDCFDHEFKATKSAINPPYGKEGEEELKFVIKQLESIPDGGLVCAIVPISKLNMVSTHRKKLFNMSKIKAIVMCNSQLFYPNANVQCGILLCEKSSTGNTGNKTIIVDYMDDGFEMKRNFGRQKNSNFEALHAKVRNDLTENNKEIFLNIDEEWAILQYDTNSPLNLSDLKRAIHNVDYHNTELEMHNASQSTNLIDVKNGKTFMIHELFDVVKKPVEKYEPGLECVFLIAAKKTNNGIKEIIKYDQNTFYGNKIVLITGGDGGAGMAFYQEMPFNISSSTAVLIPKGNVQMDKYFGIYCATQLSKYKKKYSYGYGWSLQRIKKDTIYIPIKNNEIDYDYIRSLYTS